MADLAQRLAKLSPTQRRLLEQRLKNKPAVAQPIAIVGMACRLPGATTPEEFWELISSGGTTFREISPARWDADAFYDEDPDALGKMSTKWFSCVDDVDKFDSLFFGIAPREAHKMDPQQRLLLEVSWEAIENAGIAPEQLAGTSTGVFVGIGSTDYATIPCHFSNFYETIDAHIGTGNALSIAANRISYVMDFRGPSLAMDTACSSGSVALHYAVQELRNGTCSAALAGAVNLILLPDVTIAFSKARMLSPTGECRPFDAAANGYVRGEGCTMFLLKRLTDATRDGDNILAVIRATAINQDGRTSGITAPNSLSQQACIRSAHAAAGIEAQDVTYIEAHGTGTPLGDPIEFQALSKVFKKTSKTDSPVYVSSVKANIGHTETVSGLAGLMKVVMMMQKETVPGYKRLAELNPNINLDGSRLNIPRESIAWPADKPRIAGISSFGFGGTNSHIIVEAAAVPSITTTQGADTADRPLHLLAISARTKNALPEVAARYRQELLQLDDGRVADFCKSANAGRAHFNHRAALVADTRATLLNQLGDVAGEKPNPTVQVGEVSIATKPRVAMLFTGQGSQYVGMGKSLYDIHPTFRDSIDECDVILQPILDGSIKEIIFHASESLIHQTANTQPALFALEYAMARLWQSWGVEPSAMLGHSVGEYVAACIGGVFSLEGGLKLIAKRAELMQNLPANGSMAVIFADRETVESRLRKHGKDVTVATANGPENNVISGQRKLVQKIVAEFEAEGIGTQQLRVSHAFHSPLMDPMLDEFEELASSLTYDRPTIPIVANRTGKVIETAEFNASYWRDHIRNAVEFSNGMECIDGLGIDAYLEVGPTSSLLGMGRRVVPESKAIWVASMRKGREEWKTLLHALSDLYVLGVNPDWASFDAPWQRQFVKLPNYPFQPTHFWIEGEVYGGSGRGPSVHPLLGSPIKTALPSTVYEARFAVDSPSYLQDHVVQGSVVVPGSAYIEMGMAAAEQAFGAGTHAVENIAIQQGMFLPLEGARIVETIAGSETGGRATFEAYSIDAQSEQSEPPWQLHITGTIVHSDTLPDAKPPRLPDLDEFRASAIHDLTREQSYDVFAARSLDYGPCFQVIRGFMRNQAEAIAPVQLDDAVKAKLDQYHIHPALGDALMQLTAGVIPLQENNDHAPYTYVPMRIRSFRKFRDLEEDMWMYATRTSSDDRPSAELVEADVFLISADNKIIAEMRGVTIQRIGRSIIDQVDHDIRHWMHRVEWQPADPVSRELTAKDRALLIFGSRGGIAGELAGRIASDGGKVALVSFGDVPKPLAESDGLLSAQIRSTELDQYESLLEQVTSQLGSRLDVIHCQALDAPLPDADNGQTFTSLIEATGSTPLRLVQALTRSEAVKKASLWFVTQGAQSILDDEATIVQQTPLWGLGRVAALEAAELNCRLIDLETDRHGIDNLLAEVLAGADENQIAYRGNQRFVARLVESPELLGAASDGDGMPIPSNSDYRLCIRSTGSFDALEYEAFEPESPGAGQVDVEIRATGLNFSDVLKALGLYPGITDAIVPMGIECSGIVRAVGEGVDRFTPGDEVMGVVPYAFASRGVTTDYALVRKPANLDHEEAATIPVTFLTAYYALVRLAHLQKGERVLIHAGAGGVGLAAIQIAKAIGAEIFATAGSDEKRDFLKSQGVHHVMNSRTLEFADQIAQITSQQGVDVVLNSLPGDAIEKSLACLRAYGRFLEIGKTDIYSNSKVGLLPFQDNLSYFAIDLDRMLRQKGEYIRDLFTELMTHFQSGTYQPLPFTQFETNDTIGAFRYMAQRKNIGKVVATIQQPDRADTDTDKTSLVREDGTYLITGGLGALGIRVAEKLLGNGAGAVALLSRRTPDAEKQTSIDELAKRGGTVFAVQGDVADKASLESAIAQIPNHLPPLRGVVHAAGVLADGVMFDMDLDQLNLPLQSKILGTWNLHEVTRDHPLDFFVMFSSIAAVLGSPGQSNYAAGNAFLDGLVDYRLANHLPATSMNWGPWADAGMATKASRDTQLSDRGMQSLPTDEALEVFSTILGNQTPHAAVMSVNWTDLVRAMGDRVPPILRDVATAIESGSDDGSAEDRTFRELLLGIEPTARVEKLVSFFASQLANIMGMEASDVDVVAPLHTMGMDSLMAIELKNKIERRLQTQLPMSVLIHEPSVTTLADYLAENFGLPDDEDAAPIGSAKVRADIASSVAGPHASSNVISDN